MTQRQSDQNSYTANHKGIALVIVLLALAIITAMVVEFSYAVYTGTNDLYNWRDGQRLSIMARSGINVTIKLLPYVLTEQKYSQGVMERPIENPFQDFNGTITVRVEDESSKLSLKFLVDDFGNHNNVTYDEFKRLLSVLSLNEKIADRVVDWIVKKRETGFSAPGENNKHYRLRSVDELLMIDGIDRNAYDKLLPYVTVYGPDMTDRSINVNGAGKPLLMSILHANGTFPITEDRADRIIKYRELSPFLFWGDFNRFAGTDFSADRIKTLGTHFLVKATASSGGVKRIIESVLNTSAGKIEYWKEY